MIEAFEIILKKLVEKTNKKLGSKYSECHYQRLLCYYLKEEGIDCDIEVSKDIIIDDFNIGMRRADVICNYKENKIILEIKAIQGPINKNHREQIQYYLDFFNIEYGFIIKFYCLSGFPDLNKCEPEYINPLAIQIEKYKK